ncbi:hypothetical protein OV208_36425 [Corallococcus sp. bb12-1]|uniref:hypothetical protein n=1 Tax=Corallococcus sp. bb12-1 TaxID=2996784 RepID=UPI00226EFAE4|nr:hypothetical protein [Corallococcus sp. bb12-1]MCY1046848.1 hypothetical protein [Corallococcus sp. bb12-1]
MSQIAGNKDAVGTSDFVLKWLNTWMTDQVVNGHVMGARTGMLNGNPTGMGKFIKTWRDKSFCPASGACTLDFNQAPFRLLAIVNRVDLSGSAYGSESPGELRFVFGFVDLNGLATTTNGAMKATVILEYKLTQHNDVFGWAQDWYSLAARGWGEPFNVALGQLTTRVTQYNPSVISGGSALSQARTNEIEFDTNTLANRVWELREQKRDCATGTCLLRPDTVKLTPDSLYNKSASLDGYLLANAGLINAEDLSTLPAVMVGGASRSPGAQTLQLVWDLTDGAQGSYQQNGGTFATNTRHLFALQTCNGCHYAETHSSNFHVAPRSINMRAALSRFVAPTNDQGSLEANPWDLSQPLQYHTFTDPVDFEDRQYNDLWRRQCEMQRLLRFIPEPLFKPSGGH